MHLPLASTNKALNFPSKIMPLALATGDPRPVLVQALRFLGQRDVVAWQEMSVEELLPLCGDALEAYSRTHIG
ncbi:glutamyl-Q tRNA(Asp) synthetase [Salmonella enterica subsp. enterica]|uniref:Glutamyl-Q tRNA(Asp) synthetase n=1 Tax=Salmonella enterica I TaxID=59201 RepID=A0A379X1S0_SALET|nr:glutamyl-Q tRNA(Asp) synthetase [Salmonella enterica subsp. enterica]